MALAKWKTEAGQGGRLGHSNMSHWGHTEQIKATSRKTRRAQGKELLRRERGEHMVDASH